MSEALKREFLSSAAKPLPQGFDDLLEKARALHAANKLGEARRFYKQALALQPDNPEVHSLLGAALHGLGKEEEALGALRRSVELAPDNAPLRVNLANGLMRSHAFDEAAEHLAKAREIEPNEFLYLQLLANCHFSRRNNARIEETLKVAAREFPQHWVDLVAVAQRLRLRGQLDITERLLRDLNEVVPGKPEIVGELGITLVYQNRVEEAAPFIEEVVELAPDNAIAFAALGTLRMREMRYPEAVEALERSLALDSRNIVPTIEIIWCLTCDGKVDKASFWIRRLQFQRPEIAAQYFPYILTNLNATLDFKTREELGNVYERFENCEPARMPPGFLTLLSYAHDAETTQRISKMHRVWGKHAEDTVAQDRLPPPPARAPDRKLRVALLSSDLRRHSVMKFARPLIENYDRDALELYAYSPYVGDYDDVEKEAAETVDKYVRVDGKSFKEVAEIIREDEVDVLIEMNGITRFSAIGVIPYRPAPVQVEWLGYPFTCGMKDLDYLLVDRYLAPADASYLYETPLKMPQSWICFSTFTGTPILPETPVSREGILTFGTLNNTYKYTAETLDRWAAVLRRVPNSRLLVGRPTYSAIMRSNFAHELEARGVSADRLMIVNTRKSGRNFDDFYNLIDISLDSGPLTGGTTTVDALDMGVPVVTKVGDPLHSRISYAILQHVGMSELCTHSDEEFVETAVALADDHERLQELRGSLRDRVRESVLSDHQGFATGFRDTMLRVSKEAGII